MLAKKLRFLPKLKPERAFDVVRTNTSAYGMLYSVRISSLVDKEDFSPHTIVLNICSLIYIINVKDSVAG